MRRRVAQSGVRFDVDGVDDADGAGGWDELNHQSWVRMAAERRDVMSGEERVGHVDPFENHS